MAICPELDGNGVVSIDTIFIQAIRLPPEPELVWMGRSGRQTRTQNPADTKVREQTVGSAGLMDLVAVGSHHHRRWINNFEVAQLQLLQSLDFHVVPALIVLAAETHILRSRIVNDGAVSL